MITMSLRQMRQPMMDVAFTLISITLLIVFGPMLARNLQGDWANHEDNRQNVVLLGLLLLTISLLMCCYIIHRLGFCIWKAHNRNHERRHQSAILDSITSSGSQLHLVANAELPPSYDTVVRCDQQPPPYSNVIMFDEKQRPLTLASHPQRVSCQNQALPPTSQARLQKAAPRENTKPSRRERTFLPRIPTIHRPTGRPGPERTLPQQETG